MRPGELGAPEAAARSPPTLRLASNSLRRLRVWELATLCGAEWALAFGEVFAAGRRFSKYLQLSTVSSRCVARVLVDEFAGKTRIALAGYDWR